MEREKAESCKAVSLAPLAEACAPFLEGIINLFDVFDTFHLGVLSELSIFDTTKFVVEEKKVLDVVRMQVSGDRV